MRKIIAILLTTIILLIPLSSTAMNIPGYEGGIQNENTYKEVIFVTGKPIVMEGTLTIKTKEKDNTITETYNYRLENIKENAKLTRTIKMTAKLTPRGDQITSTRTIDSFRETIDVAGRRYQSRNEDYQWNQSTVTHQKPLMDYYAGDVSARKVYTVDRDGSERITVEVKGKMVGYDSPWSSTETQTIEYVIEGEDRLNPERRWQGTATVETSYNRTKDYSYEENIPRQSSFQGGHNITENQENVLKYTYDLPRTTNNAINKGRNIGKDSFSINRVPVPERLTIPSAKDIRGHRWEEELLLLAGMDALPLNSSYLGPDTPMSRGDFARAIIKSMDIPIEKEEETRTRRKKKEKPALPLFKDVNRNHRNFDYIEEVAKRDIMVGIDKDNFEPDKSLTRVEAYSTIIRLLGLENQAPINKKYTTGYKDDKNIPAWAKDYIYVAKELGIAERGEYFYPNREITKGESAKLIVDLIHYMQRDLRRDYRENLLN